MAGRVAADRMLVPGGNVKDLVARTCPMTGRYGEVCERYDCRSGEIRVCPYWYGQYIREHGGHFGDCRSLAEAAAWMATDEVDVYREYHVLCMAAPNTLPPGATRTR